MNIGIENYWFGHFLLFVAAHNFHLTTTQPAVVPFLANSPLLYGPTLLVFLPALLFV